MSSNFLMFSLLLFCFSVLKVFCQNPITNLRVLDTYLSGASNFIHNRPLFNGLTLVLPKPPVQPPRRHPHHYVNHQSLQNLHRPQLHPIVHPLQIGGPHITPQIHPLLISEMERPDYQPVFHSIIVPKNFDKYRKTKKKSYKPKYSSKENYANRKPIRTKYPKSINERLRQTHQEKQEEEEEQQEIEEQERDKEREGDRNEIEEDPLDDPHHEEIETPKSYYDDLPPFGKQDNKPMKPVFHVKSQFSSNRTKDKSRERPQTYNKRYPDLEPESEPEPEPKYSERKRKPLRLQNDWSDENQMSDPGKSQSLFDRSPPFSTPNEFNFLKPMIQTNNDNKDNQLLSDSPEMLSNDYQNERPKKQRTATANQISLKEKEMHSHKNQFNEEKDDPAKVTHHIPKEDLESNDDPHFYPHQYAIEIRWKDRNNIHYNLDAPKGSVGDREMHSSKELDHARHRKYKHEEEEHWHEKKWLKEGLRKAYLNGKPLPVRIVKPTLKLPNGDFSPLPIYAQPLPDGMTLDQINQHFAIPTPNFRVNNRFMEWTKNSIPLTPLQNINNYLRLYG